MLKPIVRGRAALRLFVAAVLCVALASGGVPLYQDASFAGADPGRDVRAMASGGVVKVEAGYGQAFAVFGDGTLFGWGQGGNVGNGKVSYQDTFAPVTVAKAIKDVSSGHSFTLMLKKDGAVWGFGRQGFGQLGTGDVQNRTYPVKMLSGAKAKKIYAGYDQSYVIKQNGELWAAGYNVHGVLGTTTPVGSVQKSFKLVGASFTDVVSGGYSVGNLHTLGLKGGELYGWGGNNHGNLGDGTKVEKSRPTRISFPDGLKVARIIKGCWDTNAAIMEGGALCIWGASSNFQTGLNTEQDIVSPVKLMDDVRDAAFGNGFSLFLKNDGALYVAGRATITGATYKTPTLIETGVVSIEADDNNAYYVKGDGTLWSWGSSDLKGQLGNGATTGSVGVPAQVASGMKAVYTDDQFDEVVFAVKTDGSLASAGDKVRNGNGKNMDNLIFTDLAFKETAIYSPAEMKLKAIKLSAGKLSPTFKKDKLSYKTSIAAKQTKITITPVKLDSAAKIQIRNGAKFKTARSATVALAKGKSRTIQIKVIGKNGWERVYSLKITRKKK